MLRETCRWEIENVTLPQNICNIVSRGGCDQSMKGNPSVLNDCSYNLLTGISVRDQSILQELTMAFVLRTVQDEFNTS